MTILVIDVGSSSVRALLFDDNAHPIPDCIASREHHFNVNKTGRADSDAEHLRACVEACIDEILHRDHAPISAVGMATFVGNLMGVDASNQPVTPIYTYADTRSAPYLDQIKSQLDTAATLQRTGCRPHTAYHPSRFRWLHDTLPEYDSVVQWVDFGTYLYREWFGAAPCSYSVASWSGMLNRHTLTWDTDWLNLLGLSETHLPELADYDSLRTGLKPAYAARWQALKDVPFCLAVGDGAAANAGMGAVDASMIGLTVGTTAAIRIITESNTPPVVPDGLWSYRVTAKHHLTGGATSEGGNIFQWARDTLKLSLDTLETDLSQRAPDSHGLTFLPLLAGERSPGWASDATGTIHGIRLATTPLDILHAALEGVALRLSLIAGSLSGETIIAGGGALTASHTWSQIIASALNRTMHITAEPEPTARGVAILALCATKGHSIRDFQPDILYTIEPQTHAASVYASARDRQLDLYSRMPHQN